MTGVIFVLVIERTLVLGSEEITSNEIDTEDDNNKSEKSMANAETSSIDADESNKMLNSLEDVTQNTTSQDRISYHTKRGAPKYYTTIHRPKHYSHRSRPPYSKSRRKYRRSRRKPFSFPSPPIIPAGPPPSIISAGPPAISAGSSIISSGPPSGPSIISGGPMVITKSKNPFKQKPILLSELLRSSSFSKFRPNNLAPRPVHEFVNEGDLLDTNSFPPIDTFDSFPSTVNQFGRPPPSFEVTGPDSSPPLNAFGQEVIYPGVVRPTFKRPSVSGSELYSNKPSDIYLEDDAMDIIRNVRLANNPPNNYADREILNLLQKMKEDGVSLESRPETTTSRNKVKETSAAISKLLSPFLSETSIKKIRSYLNLGLSSAKKKEKDTEKNVNNIVIVENPKSGEDKLIRVPESTKDDDEGNAQYFIMLKQKNNRTASTTVGVHSPKNKAKNEKGDQTSTSTPETKTPISLQSLELQHYIMSLAGLGQSQIKDYKNDDYLPRFSSFTDAKDKEKPQS